MSSSDGISIWDLSNGMQINRIAWKGSNLSAAVADGADPLDLLLCSCPHGTTTLLRVLTTKGHQLEIPLDSIATDLLMPFLLLDQIWHARNTTEDGAKSNTSLAKKQAVPGGSFWANFGASLDGPAAGVGPELVEAALKNLRSSALRVYAVEAHPWHHLRRTAFATNAGLLLVDEAQDAGPSPVVLASSPSYSSLCSRSFRLLERRLTPSSGVVAIKDVRLGSAGSDIGPEGMGGRRPTTVFVQMTEGVRGAEEQQQAFLLSLPPNTAMHVCHMSLSPCGRVLGLATAAADVLLYTASDFVGIPVPPLPPHADVTAGIGWCSLKTPAKEMLCAVIAGRGEELVVVAVDPVDHSAEALVTTATTKTRTVATSAGVVGSRSRSRRCIALFGGPVIAAVVQEPSAASPASIQLMSLEARHVPPPVTATGHDAGSSTSVGAALSVVAKVLHEYSAHHGAAALTATGGWTPQFDALFALFPQQQALEVCALRPLGGPLIHNASSESAELEVEFATWSFSLAPFSCSRVAAERSFASHWGEGWGLVFMPPPPPGGSASAGPAMATQCAVMSPASLFVLSIHRSELPLLKSSRCTYPAVSTVTITKHIPMLGIRCLLGSRSVRYGAAALSISALRAEHGPWCDLLISASSGEYVVVSW
jgi:hypothetical protein